MNPLITLLSYLYQTFGHTRFEETEVHLPETGPAGVSSGLLQLGQQGLVTMLPGSTTGHLQWWVTAAGAQRVEHPEAKPVTAAVTYIPGEEDVDPEVLAEGKGKEDVESRDHRDDNAGDRAGIHTSSLHTAASEPEDATGFISALHGYLDHRAELAREGFTRNEIHAEPLNDPEWLDEITPGRVTAALVEAYPQAAQVQAPGLLHSIVKALKQNPQPYTELACVGVNLKPGEIQSYSLGEQEIVLFSDPEWQELETRFDPGFVLAHLSAGLDSYRGTLQFSATYMHLKLRAHDQPIQALLDLSGQRWVRYLTPAGAQALLTHATPGGHP